MNLWLKLAHCSSQPPFSASCLAEPGPRGLVALSACGLCVARCVRIDLLGESASPGSVVSEHSVDGVTVPIRLWILERVSLDKFIILALGASRLSVASARLWEFLSQVSSSPPTQSESDRVILGRHHHGALPSCARSRFTVLFSATASD